MYTKSSIKKLLDSFDLLPSVPMGKELSSAVYSDVTGIPYYKILFSIPGMSDRIMNMSSEIKECNAKYKNGEVDDQYVFDLKEKRESIINDISETGLLVNWDILDNIWDKLPGD